MSITTYEELKAALAELLNRSDLDASLSDFIALAESELSSEIDHYEFEGRSSGVLDTRYTALPDGFLSPIRLHYSTADGTHAVRPMSQVGIGEERLRCGDASGRPRFYAITAGTIEVVPTPDDAYPMEFVYRRRIDALSDDNPTNWILTNYPALYLYQSAIHSAPFLREDTRLSTWAALAQSNLDRVNAEGERAKHGGTGLRMNIRSY